MHFWIQKTLWVSYVLTVSWVESARFAPWKQEVNKPTGRILMEFSWKVAWSTISRKKNNTVHYAGDHIRQILQSVPLFKSRISNDIWGVNRVKNRTVVVSVIILYILLQGYQHFGEICYPTIRTKYRGRRLLRKLVPTYQITRCHDLDHSQNQTALQPQCYTHSCAARTIWSASGEYSKNLFI